MSEALADLLHRVDQLESIHAIERVSASYCRGADQRDIGVFLSAWAEDGVWEVSPELRFVGLADISEAIQHQWRNSQRAAHWTSNGVIDVHGDTASALFDVNSETQLLDGQWITISGAYSDRYVRRDATWKLAKRSAFVYSQHSVESGPG